MYQYTIYARKSSESEDRQVQSIDSQVKELNKFAKDRKLNVSEILTESASAKAPGRKVFNQLLEKIKNKQTNGIIVWNPDRLSRNSVDAGQLIYFLDLGLLSQIVTPFQTFENNPNDKFMLQILWGQAKLDNDNKGINVKRGMKAKAESGWNPAPAPQGYVNANSKRYKFPIIKKDPKRFELLQMAWIKLLDGDLPSDVYNLITEEWKVTNRYSGSLISKSAFYNMLKNPFYYGLYEWPKNSGNFYQGKHQPMITKDQFDEIRQLLGKTDKPVRRIHESGLKGVFHCAECGCMYTTTHKTKHYPRTGNTQTYVYCHCTRKRKDISCSQKPLKADDVINQIGSELAKMDSIPQGFIEWAKKWNQALDEHAVDNNQTVIDQLGSTKKKLEKRLSNLLDMRLNQEIDEPVFTLKQTEIQKEIRQVSKQVRKLTSNDKSLSDEVNDALDFAKRSQKEFVKDNPRKRYKILSKLGSNHLIKGKKARLNKKNVFVEISEYPNWSNRYKDWLEPQIYTDILGKRPGLVPQNPSWLPG